jgi:hypothetical protein
MTRNRKRLVAALAVLLLCSTGVAAAQVAMTTPGQQGTWCPQSEFVAGDAGCVKTTWPTPTTLTETKTETVTVSPTTTTTTTTTTTVPSTTTTTAPPAAPVVGSDAWKATTGLTTPESSLTLVSGNLTTTSNGQVIDGKKVTGNLVVQHDNVVVTNSRIQGVVQGSNLRGLTLRHVDLGRDSCPGSTNGGTRLVSGGNYTLENSRLHHNGADLVNLAAGTITMRDSWLGQTCYYNGDHLDAVQMYNPGQNVILLVERSFLDSRAANGSNLLGNGAVFIADNPGVGSNFVLKNNLFAGGNYTTSFYDSSKFEVRDNKYVAGSYRYGPCSSTNTIVFTGNTLDTGAAVSC